MDYIKIVNECNKYHYYITTKTKIIFLSSSNKKSEAKAIALLKLKPNINNLIGKNLILIRVKCIINSYNDNNNRTLNIMGGPIVIIIKRGLIMSENIIKNYQEGGNNNIYLSENYIIKNKLNILVDLINIITDYINDNLNKGLLNLNILN